MSKKLENVIIVVLLTVLAVIVFYACSHITVVGIERHYGFGPDTEVEVSLMNYPKYSAMYDDVDEIVLGWED